MQIVNLNAAIITPRVRELLEKLRESDNGNGVITDTVDELERILSQQVLSGASSHNSSARSRGPASSATTTSHSTIRVGTAIGCFTRLGKSADSEPRSAPAANSTTLEASSFALPTRTSATASSPTGSNADRAPKSDIKSTPNISIDEKKYIYHRYTDELTKFLVETAQKYQDVTGRYSWDPRTRRYRFTEVSKNMLYLAQIVHGNKVCIERAFLNRMEEMLVLRVEVASELNKEAQEKDTSVAESNERHYFFNQRVHEVMELLRRLPVKES